MQTLLVTVEIQSNSEGWRLEVVNTITGKQFHCDTLEAMNERINMLYSLYEDHTLQVEWLKSPLARPDHINEIRQQIDEMQRDLAVGDGRS